LQSDSKGSLILKEDGITFGIFLQIAASAVVFFAQLRF
jgi:hypothetical protein